MDRQERRDHAEELMILAQQLADLVAELFFFADGGYAGEKLRTALKRIGEWTIEIIKRSDTAQGFEVLPRKMGRRTYFRMARSLS
jgi:transposase